MLRVTRRSKDKAFCAFFLSALFVSFSLHANAAGTRKLVEEEVLLDPIIVLGESDDVETVATSEVDEELLDRLQATTVPEILDGIPGTDLAGTARAQGQSVNIWGFADQEDVKFLLDGAQKEFEKYRQGTVFIEPQLLKTISLEKGSYSAESFGAFGGTVNMTTKTASDLLKSGQNIGFFSKLGFASNGNEFAKTVAAYGRSEKYGAELIVSATHRKNDNYQLSDDRELPLSAITQPTGFFKGSLERGSHFFEITGAAYYSNDLQPWAAKGTYKVLSDTYPDRKSYEEAISRKSTKRELKDRSLAFKYEFNPDNELINTTFESNYSNTNQHDLRTNINRTYDLLLGGKESWLDYTNYKASFKNAAEFDLFRLEAKLETGLQFSNHMRDVMVHAPKYKDQEDYNHGWLQAPTQPGGKQTIYSAWSALTMNFGNGLQLRPGLRFDYILTEGDPNLGSRYNNPTVGHDYSSVEHSGLSPSFNVLLPLSNNFRVFGDWAYKLRAPLIDEIYDTGTRRATSDQLTVERVNSKRLGFTTSHSSVIQPEDTIKTRFSIFRNDVSNNIHRLYKDNRWLVPSDDYPTYANLKGYYTQGIEAEIYYDSDNFIGSLAFSAGEGKFNGTARNVNFETDQYVSEIAPTKLIATLGYKIPDQDVTFGWKGSFYSGQDRITRSADNKYSATKGYSLFDIFVSWTPTEGRFEDLEARASVGNLLDRKYRNHFSDTYGKSRNYKASLSYKF
ncbi:TonB-dependent receptor [Pseudovibrio sp. Tun.PSC04-5.I4]|uniref:TonB-dependent receptor domain-containing protein n=1 Tax=Pseudovibrio sp. Tun.PSC04-5.I4 TaxID=1798213 RepID=UPI00089181D9|nr:TonB-dependent receptor [Pseudovibrio sp. Tun.PSC04-5.I4]SDQ37245.1 hemoglobin/transferrin/lactoferrin receptor protein [Pseudovibrio sp. Tun.PSC04-5.I4]